MDPYDPNAAFEAIRPRLAAARARRRRAVATSAAAGLLALSSVAAAAVLTPDAGERVVATSPDETPPPSPAPTPPESTEEGAVAAQDPAPVEPKAEPPQPVEPKPAPPPTEAPKPAAPPPTEAPKPTPPPTEDPPAAATRTFTYPGTGSVTVSQQGTKLALVGTTVESGWTVASSHDAPDLVKVEFRRDNVTRWLKVKVVNGVAVAEQLEQVACVPEPGSSTHQAPAGAGSMTVQVASSGALSLVDATPAPGWSTEVYYDGPDLVKVGFRNGPDLVWVLVKVHGCALKVETG